MTLEKRVDVIIRHRRPGRARDLFARARASKIFFACSVLRPSLVQQLVIDCTLVIGSVGSSYLLAAVSLY